MLLVLNHTMKSGLNFLVAARQCEIGELEALAVTSELVGVAARLIHALQRERGLSNVFLASHGKRFSELRLSQIDECTAVELRTRTHFDAMDTDTTRVRNGARLFSRIAVVLHGLDALPGLRARVLAQDISPDDSTATFTRLIAGLLAVVFEAADSAMDPEISRALVAMFNFMQGKEFAGQERAIGSAAFASGRADAARQQQWQHVIESQERCFEVFADFSDAGLLEAWDAARKNSPLADIERLRRIGCAIKSDGRLDAELSQLWYDCCTQRIDSMKGIEDLLAANLRVLCERKILEARAELRDQKTIVDSLSREATTAGAQATMPYGPHLERSILDMVQEQARRLQTMGDELETVRGALNERKVVERAKGLLMAARKLSEEDAYKMLRQTAMNQNRRLLDVAQSVLSMSEYL